MTALRFGVAAAEITPPVGIHMGGYWGRSSGATQIRDALLVKALVCECGAERFAIAAVDLVALDAGSVGRIRARLEREAGFAAVMVCASHTHAGPLTVRFRGMGEVDTGYLQRVEDEIVRIVAAAAAAMQAGRLRYARPAVQIGINRRRARGASTGIGQHPDGPIVPYAHVLRFEAANGPGATLFNHACHPVVLGHQNHQISGDFAAAAARYVETETGEPALYINGACGDINPRITNGDFSDVEALGSELGGAVLAAIDTAGPIAVSALGCAQARVDLPLIEPPPRLHAEAEKLVLQLKAELKRGGDIWAQRVPRARLEWAQAMLKLARKGAGAAAVQPFEIQVLALGDMVVLGMEGEIFCRYQLDLEAEFGPAVLCGFANGCIGYVPTADENSRGGYEVDEAYKVYPSVQMIAPASEALIRQGVAELVAGVRRGITGR